jgi:hypothetical protein
VLGEERAVRGHAPGHVAEERERPFRRVAAVEEPVERRGQERAVGVERPLGLGVVYGPILSATVEAWKSSSSS